MIYISHRGHITVICNGNCESVCSSDHFHHSACPGSKRATGVGLVWVKLELCVPFPLQY